MSDWATRDLPRPSAFIQWKGTEVCMDCYCVCGEQFHIDASFTYAVACWRCGRRYEMSSMIEMREMPPEEKWDGCEPYVEDPRSNVECTADDIAKWRAFTDQNSAD